MITTAREEQYLAKYAGEDVPIPEPKTRAEMYLAKMAGMDIDPPAPITREEQILSAIAENGGGGGSSDFSTAILTLVGDDDLARIRIPIYSDYPLMYGSSTDVIYVGENHIILYKGTCIIGPFFDGLDSKISISGDCEWVTLDETTFLKITGDCTITYTPER